jgi:hypothetical protein
MPIGREEKTFMLSLKRLPILQGSEKIPEMHEPAGLHAAEYA